VPPRWWLLMAAFIALANSDFLCSSTAFDFEQITTRVRSLVAKVLKNFVRALWFHLSKLYTSFAAPFRKTLLPDS